MLVVCKDADAQLCDSIERPSSSTAVGCHADGIYHVCVHICRHLRVFVRVEPDIRSGSTEPAIMDHIDWCRDSRLDTFVEHLMTPVQANALIFCTSFFLSRTCVHWALVGCQDRLFAVVLFIALYFRLGLRIDSGSLILHAIWETIPHTIYAHYPFPLILSTPFHDIVTLFFCSHVCNGQWQA